jgi:hypothetical protein
MHKNLNAEEIAILEEAALHIDPASAEVEWIYAELIIDSHREVRREYFARSPGSDIWVWFGDLPAATQKSLGEKHRPKLTYPAGLFLPLRDVPRSPEGENVVELEHSTFNLYGISREALVIDCGDDMNLACVPLERASLLIEQSRAFLEILEADALDAGARA